MALTYFNNFAIYHNIALPHFMRFESEPNQYC